MNEVRLGIVGLGNMGRTHRQTIIDGQVPGLKVTALCGRPDSLAALPEIAGESRFTDVEAMIASGCIDALLCCTPHPTTMRRWPASVWCWPMPFVLPAMTRSRPAGTKARAAT